MDENYESKWERVGEVGVDSGHLILIDPCYIIKDKPYDEFCAIMEKAKWPKTMAHKGGIVTSTGFGDGSYDVFAKVTDYKEMGKRVTEIRIVFGEYSEGIPSTPLENVKRLVNP